MEHEAMMICFDNSEWMRNEDYGPSRFQVQLRAVYLISRAKTLLDPDNTVGVLTMAGKRVHVLITPTNDQGKIMACVEGIEIGGEMNLAAAIKVAQMALKHRRNKRHQQRIVVFAGSPVKHDKQQLEIIGRTLKKNSVALDIVSFGEDDEEKKEKLEALLAAVNSGDTSHIVHIPPGPFALAGVLMNTPIFPGYESGFRFSADATAAASGGIPGCEFRVNPTIDPDLALALRISMEEEDARQEKAAEKAAKQVKGGDTTTADSSSLVDSEKSDFEDEEDAMLQQAIKMSLDESPSGHDARNTEMSDADVDEPDIALALQFSVLESAKDSSDQSSNMGKTFADYSFVSSTLESVPRVDPNDTSAEDLLASTQKQNQESEQGEEEEEKGH